MTHKHIAFVAPLDMAEALQRLATREERTVSAQLRLMVRAHLENESAQPLDKAERSQDRAMTEPANEV